MRTPLSQNEYESISLAIDKQPFDRILFKRGVSKINSGSAVRPKGMTDNSFPWTLTDWRRNPEASKKHLRLHMDACEKAFQAYWYVMQKSDFA